MIKNIVFDFGGVVLTEDDVWLTSRKTKMLLGLDDQNVLDNAWNVAWPDGRDGKSSENDFFQTFLTSAIGKTDPKLVLALKNIYRQETGMYSAFPLLKILRGKYKLYGMPNITKDWLEYKIEKYDLGSYFDLIVSSCEEGVAKPHKEIFLSLVNKAKINPNETLFVDNMEKNIVVAKEMGFETHLYFDIESLRRAMVELGIKND